MKVCIGIITHNRVHILQRAIESSIKQSYAYKEIIVYDDFSIDNTRKLVESYPTIKWIFADENKGYLFARNHLMKNTDADLYCSLDDNAWFLKGDELEKAVDIFKNNPNIAALAFDILSHNKTEIKQRAKPYLTNSFIGCGHILSIDKASEVGYYKKYPGLYGVEEKELCLNLISKGYDIIYLPGVHVWHDKTLTDRNLQKQHRSGVCNDLVFAFRKTPIYLLPLSLLVKTIKHIVFAIRYEQDGFLKECLLGLVDFYSLLFKNKLSREPVSYSTLKTYLGYNK